MKDPVKCLECGELFIPIHENHKVCGRSCQRARKRKTTKEGQGLYDAKRMRAAQAAKPTPQKTDWSAITKLCLEHHISYGEAVSRGLL